MEDEEKGLRVSTHPVVGRLISNKVLNSEEVVSTIRKEWTEPMYGKIDIKHLNGNTYLFSFNSVVFAEKVIRHGPWVILGHFLCLKHWESHMNLEEVALRHVPIWVQMHGLIWGHNTNEYYAKYIGNHIGTFLRSKWSRRQDYLRVKVLLDCYGVVKTGMWISSNGGRQFHVDFKYERMADLCFNCGRFGHGTKECRQNKIPHPQFGPWLRATKAPSPQDEDKDEERKEKSLLCWNRLNALALCAVLALIFIMLTLAILFVPICSLLHIKL